MELLDFVLLLGSLVQNCPTISRVVLDTEYRQLSLQTDVGSLDALLFMAWKKNQPHIFQNRLLHFGSNSAAILTSVFLLFCGKYFYIDRSALEADSYH